MSKIDSILWCDVELDIFSSTVRIIYDGSVIVDEPAIVAVEPNTQKILAIGKEAMQYEKDLVSQVYFDGHNYEEYNTLYIGSAYIRGLLIQARKTKKLRGLLFRLTIPLPSTITHNQQRVIESFVKCSGVPKYHIVYR